MSRALPSLNAIRVFEAAARHGSFSRAAHELSVTQSAVSRQIHHLEQQIGQLLFVRNGPRLALTESGREYSAVVQEGLGVIKRGTDRLFRLGSRPVLTISTLPSVISKWLVPRLHDFERQHPEISLHLSASYQVIDFAVSTDIDAGIRFGKGQWAGLVADLILDDVIFPVCNREVARRLKTPRDLLRQRLLGEQPNWDLWDAWFVAAGLEQPPPRPDRLSDDFNVQLQAAFFGHGIALARGMLVADDLREGRLVCPFPIFAPSPIQYYFVSLPERRREPAVRAIRNWLLNAAQESVADLRAIAAGSRHSP
jgi:LysR family glycine cleavage system transcriptional activator